MKSQAQGMSDLQRVESAFGPLWAFADDLITKQIVDFGAHTRNELAMVLDHVRPGDIVVDIGSHIGTYAIPIATKVGPQGRVLAIEGDPTTFAVLVRNVGLNALASRIQCRNQIVGDSNVQRFERTETQLNSGAGYYQRAATGDLGTDSYAALAESGFARPHFVKIDVEGMEGAILRSIRPLLAARRPALYIEVVEKQLARFGDGADTIDALLRPYEYRLFRNVGQRNSASDDYRMQPLRHVRDGGVFFDLLALPPDRSPAG